MENPTATPDLMATDVHSLHRVRTDVDQVLDVHYKGQAARGRIFSPDYEFLWQALNRQHQAGGKRLRPYLCILTYEALGGRSYQEVLPVAAGLELLHTAMLIHDDIIDRDYSRRNQPNIAGLYQTKYEQMLPSEAEKNHFANAAALLAGDLALSDSYQLVLSSAISDTAKVKVSQLLGDAVYHVVAGELLDSEAAIYPLDQADSLQIAELKTAQYSFSTPLSVGAVLAGSAEPVQRQLQSFGVKLGVAFQLADDILGVFGDATKTGKTTVGDIREGKRTYLLQQTYLMASPAEQQTLSGIVGNSACDEAMADIVRQVMETSGAKAKTERLMHEYASAAEELLDTLAIDQAYVQQFRTFIQQAVWRKR